MWTVCCDGDSMLLVVPGSNSSSSRVVVEPAQEGVRYLSISSRPPLSGGRHSYTMKNCRPPKAQTQSPPTQTNAPVNSVFSQPRTSRSSQRRLSAFHHHQLIPLSHPVPSSSRRPTSQRGEPNLITPLASKNTVSSRQSLHKLANPQNLEEENMYIDPTPERFSLSPPFMSQQYTASSTGRRRSSACEGMVTPQTLPVGQTGDGLQDQGVIDTEQRNIRLLETDSPGLLDDSITSRSSSRSDSPELFSLPAASNFVPVTAGEKSQRKAPINAGSASALGQHELPPLYLRKITVPKEQPNILCPEFISSRRRSSACSSARYRSYVSSPASAVAAIPRDTSFMKNFYGSERYNRTYPLRVVSLPLGETLRMVTSHQFAERCLDLRPELYEFEGGEFNPAVPIFLFEPNFRLTPNESSRLVPPPTRNVCFVRRLRLGKTGAFLKAPDRSGCKEVQQLFVGADRMGNVNSFVLESTSQPGGIQVADEFCVKSRLRMTSLSKTTTQLDVEASVVWHGKRPRLYGALVELAAYDEAAHGSRVIQRAVDAEIHGGKAAPVGDQKVKREQVFI